jgi:hypothetical protein
MVFKSLVGATIAVALSALPVHAATMSYYLDQTNVDGFSGGLPDGVNYLNVTIDDEGGDGTIGGDALINVTVSIIGGAFTYNDGTHGIMDFAFNITNDPSTLTTDNIINLPSMWEAMHFNNTTDIKASNADGFGKFDVRLTDGGQNRVDPLTFSIDIAGDSINSYFDQAATTVGQSQENAWFAAHVAGIMTGAYAINGDSGAAECDPDTYADMGAGPCLQLPSAWFGGGVGDLPPASVVPEPLSAALVGTAVLGLVAIRRKIA